MGGNLPFIPGVYQPNSTIAEMILKAGQQRAQLQQDASQNLAGTVQQLGQIPGQIQRQRQQEAQIARETQQAASQKALTDRQTAEYQRAGQERDTLDTAMAGQGQPGFDSDAIAARLPGHMRAAFQEQVAKANEAADKADSAKADYFGRLAAGVEPYLKSSDGGVGAAGIALQHAKARGYNVDPILAKIQADPSQLPMILQGFIASSPTMSKEKREENKPVSIGPRGLYNPATSEVISGGPEKETRTVDEQLAAAQLAGDQKTVATLLDVKRKAALASHVTDPSQKLVKVEHKDPTTGHTVIEWLPQSEVKGKTYEKGTSGTVEARLASAEAVNQTGTDIINKLKDPAYAKVVGPAMGRLGKVRDWLGDPPPELAELAGLIESYSLANMGVHGMRSVQGSEKINKLLDSHHTPESLIAAINGLQGFLTHFMQNEGRGGKAPGAGAFKVGGYTVEVVQ